MPCRWIGPHLLAILVQSTQNQCHKLFIRARRSDDNHAATDIGSTDACGSKLRHADSRNALPAKN
jgi:hypothetical protein